MKKVTTLSFLLLFLTVQVFADNTAQLVSKDSYKYKVAKKVYDKLIDAKGDKRLLVPEFTMNKGKRYVAWMNGKKNQIGLEEAAYDVCAKFGKDSLNAMASLLGHEIIHYYEKHSWNSDFASAFTNLDISGDIKSASVQTKATHETEADYLGGFLAYSAGYQTFGIMPVLLGNVYAYYELEDEMKGYPSLSDRQKLAQESEVRVQELINVFDASSYMIALEQYEDVDSYFEFILKEYQSREIYNNAGVNAAMGAMTYFSEDEMKFTYPIQLDGETRLSLGTKSDPSLGFGERKEKREKLLIKALHYFEQAKALDKEYATAFLNVACIADMLGDYDEAEFFAKKASKIAKASGDSKVEGDAYIMRGIVAVHLGEEGDAQRYFHTATMKNPMSKSLAQANIDALDGNKRKEVVAKPKLSLSQEMIGNTSLDDFMEAIDVDNLLKINKNIQCGIKEYKDSKILLNLVKGGSRFTLMHIAGKNYTDATGEGIRIGSSSNDVANLYGAPSHLQQSRQGLFVIYDFKNIAFRIDDGKVVGWCVYRVKDEN